MSNEPNTLWRRWRTTALTWLAYAVVVVTAIALFGPALALTIAKLAFVPVLLGSYLHRKLQTAIDVDDSEPLPAEHPDAPSGST